RPIEAPKHQILEMNDGLRPNDPFDIGGRSVRPFADQPGEVGRRATRPHRRRSLVPIGRERTSLSAADHPKQSLRGEARRRELDSRQAEKSGGAAMRRMIPEDIARRQGLGAVPNPRPEPGEDAGYIVPAEPQGRCGAVDRGEKAGDLTFAWLRSPGIAGG